jgi:hypothetical protein
LLRNIVWNFRSISIERQQAYSTDGRTPFHLTVASFLALIRDRKIVSDILRVEPDVYGSFVFFPTELCQQIICKNLMERSFAGINISIDSLENWPLYVGSGGENLGDNMETKELLKRQGAAFFPRSDRLEVIHIPLGFLKS